MAKVSTLYCTLKQSNVLSLFELSCSMYEHASPGGALSPSCLHDTRAPAILMLAHFSLLRFPVKPQILVSGSVYTR